MLHFWTLCFLYLDALVAHSAQGYKRFWHWPLVYTQLEEQLYWYGAH